MGLSNYSGFSAGQQQPPRIKSEFSSSRKDGPQHDLQADHEGNITTKRPSLMQALGSNSNPKTIPRPPYEAADVRSNRSYFAKTQEEMWSEFNNHFRNPNRPNVKINHHDFLDGSFLTKLKDQNSRRTFFS